MTENTLNSIMLSIQRALTNTKCALAEARASRLPTVYLEHAARDLERAWRTLDPFYELVSDEDKRRFHATHRIAASQASVWRHVSISLVHLLYLYILQLDSSRHR